MHACVYRELIIISVEKYPLPLRLLYTRVTVLISSTLPLFQLVLILVSLRALLRVVYACAER